MKQFFIIFLSLACSVLLFQNCETGEQPLESTELGLIVGDEEVENVTPASLAKSLEFELISTSGHDFYNIDFENGMVKRGIERVYSSEVRPNGEIVQIQLSQGGEELGCLRSDLLQELQELVVGENICQFTRLDAEELVCTLAYTPSLADVVFEKNIFSLRNSDCGQRFHFCNENNSNFQDFIEPIKADIDSHLEPCN